MIGEQDFPMTGNSEQPTKKRKFPWEKALCRPDIEGRIGMTMKRLASTAITVRKC